MLCFLHLPKSGGSTLNGALRRSYGARHVDLISLDGPDQPVTARDVTLANRLHPWVRSVASHQVCIHKPVGDNSWKWFTIVREPVARTISEYQFYRNRLNGTLDLRDYVEMKDITNLQVRRIAGTADLELATSTLTKQFIFTGVMEHFDLSLAALEVLSDEASLSMAYVRKNSADDHSIAEEIRRNPATMRYLEEITQLDAELYATVRDEIFPECLERARSVASLRDVSARPPSRVDAKLLTNRLVRNLWYKPVVRTASLVLSGSTARAGGN